MNRLEKDDMFDRCVRSHLRAASRAGGTADQPSRADSGFDKKGVFHLRNVRGVLRSYTYDANANRIREVK